MQDKMKKLLEQIGMSNNYLENASIEKIVVYDKTNLWEFIINNDKILPVYIYDELCNKLKHTFKSIDNKFPQIRFIIYNNFFNTCIF